MILNNEFSTKPADGAGSFLSMGKVVENPYCKWLFFQNGSFPDFFLNGLCLLMVPELSVRRKKPTTNHQKIISPRKRLFKATLRHTSPK
jgi:hypothetical protein